MNSPKIYLGKRSTWLQILFWGGLWMIIPYLVNAGALEMMPEHRSEIFFYRNLIIFAGIFILVFINLEWLIPKFYVRKQIFAYIVGCMLVLLLLLTLLNWNEAPWADWISPGMRKSRRPFGPRVPFASMRYLSSAMPFLTSLLGSSLFAIARIAIEKEQETVQLQKEKLETEMKFLKSQINPHFLFNSLNNIYTQILVKSDEAGPNLLKLSHMLRYMLYDCRSDRVALIKEIEYIDNYVELIKLKDSEGLNIDLELDRSHPDIMIAPLLFIPFIENAFKHSKIEDLATGWIKIRLSAAQDVVHLIVQNSIPAQSFEKDKLGGIGLENVKKQLQLLYPDKHVLQIDEMDEQYHVSLTIHV